MFFTNLLTLYHIDLIDVMHNSLILKDLRITLGKEPGTGVHSLVSFVVLYFLLSILSTCT